MKCALRLIVLASILISGTALAAPATVDCQIGNFAGEFLTLAPSGSAFLGLESYKLIVGPEDRCPSGDAGLKIEKIYMYVFNTHFGPPIDFMVSADVETAIWDGECFGPGDLVASSDPVSVDLQSFGAVKSLFR